MLLPSSALAQPASDSAAARLGRSQVARAFAVLGGDSVLARIATLDVRGTGTEWRSAEVQGRSPDHETPTPHEEWIVADVRRERLVHEYRTPRHDGSLRWRRFIYDGEERIVGDFVNRSAGRGHAPSAAQSRRELRRRFPHLLVAEVVANSASVRALGDSVIGKRVHHVVSYTPAGHRTPLHLFIDRATGFIRSVAQDVEFPGIGDATVRLELMPYVRHDQLRFVPTGHVLRLAGARFQEVRYTHVKVNDTSSDSAFELPEDLRPFASAPGTVRRVAPGVFIVESLDGFNTMFVEFRDFVLAVEAPSMHPTLGGLPVENPRGSTAIAETFIERITQTVPGKPIRYVAVTHFHSDHAGGVRAFLDRGTAILTTPGNRAFFERLAPGVSRLETITGKRVLTDGEQTVEIIDVGRNPHTDEMLVVHLPQHGILFQGDLFYFSGESMFPDPGRVGIMRHFAQWLARNGIAPRRIYGVHGTGYATMEHVRRVVPPPR
jgi:glyoxylase-like metal-dependent hydrolase (beta-lactamase superfamily II)